MRFGLILALATLSASACANPPPRDPHEIFDEQSGNTLLVVPKPLVFARERRDVAAHERDYATLVAVEIDQSGKYSEYLLLYRWSTVDRRMSPPPDLEAGELKILADGRIVDLTPLERVPIGLSQRRELHVPEHGDIVTHAYPIDVSTLRFIATSRELGVRMPQESLDTPFTIWEDGRSALGQFLERSVAP
ncbi:MAG TPA: hypothetical protein VNX69_14685 [Steroidobacteraceae bacterium]|nr:hypothetical protein [Steroidobacteraceae bacterium]